jgi:hypothetical protein
LTTEPFHVVFQQTVLNRFRIGGEDVNIAPLAADAIRLRMEEAYGLRKPIRPTKRREVPPPRVRLRIASAAALRGLADRLEPSPNTL